MPFKQIIDRFSTLKTKYMPGNGKLEACCNILIIMNFFLANIAKFFTHTFNIHLNFKN